jgi:hypothetical protein
MHNALPVYNCLMVSCTYMCRMQSVTTPSRGVRSQLIYPQPVRKQRLSTQRLYILESPRYTTTKLPAVCVRNSNSSSRRTRDSYCICVRVQGCNVINISLHIKLLHSIASTGSVIQRRRCVKFNL